MRLEQRKWTGGAAPASDGAPLGDAAQVVFAFGSTEILSESRYLPEIRRLYPRAYLFGCSTAGEIMGAEVSDDSLVTTAVAFAHTKLRTAQVAIADCLNSQEAGKRLAQQLPREGLVHVLVLSDGTKVNGTDLTRGMQQHLPSGVAVTGGLSGDGTRFERTIVLAGDAVAPGIVAVVGLYGSRLKVGYGSLGGWDPFGPERIITRSKENVLFELDGRPALSLYKTYLGEHAAGLPATGLLFPLSLRMEGRELVRTILAVNEADQSMTFAGDLPQGATARLMKANFDRLVDGAEGAASRACLSFGKTEPELALLISCVGRKLVLKQRTEEELERVREVVGKKAVMTGFYSYGEICPSAPSASCELHNQTMTITTFLEE
jgi:hypothetical protein